MTIFKLLKLMFFTLTKNAVSEWSMDISNLFMMLTTNFGPQQTKKTTIIIRSILITCNPNIRNCFVRKTYYKTFSY